MVDFNPIRSCMYSIYSICMYIYIYIHTPYIYIYSYIYIYTYFWISQDSCFQTACFPCSQIVAFPFLSQTFEVRPRLTEAGGLTASVPWPFLDRLPSGKHTKNYGKSPCSMRKSTISMVIFNSCVKLPEGIGSVMLIHLNTSYIIFFYYYTNYSCYN